jgi:hypothetical protein
MRGLSSGALALLATCGAALAGCSGDGGPTQQLHGAVGRLVSPNGAEGAAVIEIAASVDSVEVLGGEGFLRPANGVTRIAVVLDQPGTIRFGLPRLPRGTGPTATVVQVADGNNQLRADVAAYRVDYER